jgi:hypothetical protein
MRKAIGYATIVGGILLVVLTILGLLNIREVKAQYYYVVGGGLEVPEISKGGDYSTLIIVGGVAAAAILIGLYVIQRKRE